MPTKDLSAISFVPKNRYKNIRKDRLCPEELVLWQDEICFEERIEDGYLCRIYEKLLKNLPQQPSIVHGWNQAREMSLILNIVDNGNVIEKRSGEYLKE